MTLNLLSLDKIFIDIVKRYDALKTYARLEGVEDFGDTSLNKTKKYLDTENLNIFYSEKWNDNNNNVNKINFDYPALVMFNNTFQGFPKTRKNSLFD